jgi:hypothetical protein
MALTRDQTYYDKDNDSIEVQKPDEDAVEEHGALGLIYLSTNGGTYVMPEYAAPLALNVLGYDREDVEPLAISVSAEDAVVQIARTPMTRDFQLRHAAALLKAVDAYDTRAIKLARDEERRTQAADWLATSVRRIATQSTFGNAEIGKLREALGRYDAELAN